MDNNTAMPPQKALISAITIAFSTKHRMQAEQNRDATSHCLHRQRPHHRRTRFLQPPHALQHPPSMPHPSRLLPALAALVAACSSSAPDARDTRNAATAALPPVARPLTPSDSACPRDGRWRPCSLEDRINKAGLAFKPGGDSLRVPYLATPGVRYRLGKSATLAALFYADSAAGAADTAPLDPDRLTPRGDSLGGWPSVPTEVIRSANLIVVLLDASETQAERVRLALQAGAPVLLPPP
jgi:hypothetical protein